MSQAESPERPVITLLQQLHTLSTHLTSQLQDPETDLDTLEPLLEAREVVLGRLAALAPADRHLDSTEQPLLTAVQTLETQAQEHLQARQQALHAERQQLRSGHHVLQTYQDDLPPDAQFIEQST